MPKIAVAERHRITTCEDLLSLPERPSQISGMYGTRETGVFEKWSQPDFKVGGFAQGAVDESGDVPKVKSDSMSFICRPPGYSPFNFGEYVKSFRGMDWQKSYLSEAMGRFSGPRRINLSWDRASLMEDLAQANAQLWAEAGSGLTYEKIMEGVQKFHDAEMDRFDEAAQTLRNRVSLMISQAFGVPPVQFEVESRSGPICMAFRRRIQGLTRGYASKGL